MNTELPKTHLRSEDLTLENVPDPATATRTELWQFVLRYHAYIVHGGVAEAFDACGPLTANMTKVQMLDMLRVNVFADIRAAHHQGNEQKWVEESVREVVEIIRDLLTTPLEAREWLKIRNATPAT